MQRYPLHLDGHTRPARAGRWFPSDDPYRGQPWAEVARGDAADADDAVQARTRARR